MDYVEVAFSDEDLAKRKVTVYWEIKLLNVPKLRLEGRKNFFGDCSHPNAPSPPPTLSQGLDPALPMT